jgi:hypothetical protein
LPSTGIWFLPKSPMFTMRRAMATLAIAMPTWEVSIEVTQVI